MSKMDTKLQNKLYKKYPKIFKQHSLSVQQSGMGWGILTGNGWYWLIDKLCESIQSFIDNNPTKIPQIEAVEVKEKFGGLRFYIDGAPEEIHGMIHFAEDLSYDVCEVCGNPKKTSKLCKECKKKKIIEAI